MSKFIEYINSDDSNALSSKFAISIVTWLLIFFYLVPILLAIIKNIFNINNQGSSTTSSIINISLYYILNPIIATLVVKWQNKKLANKPLKFKKIYCLAVSLILLIFTLVSIFQPFYYQGITRWRSRIDVTLAISHHPRNQRGNPSPIPKNP